MRKFFRKHTVWYCIFSLLLSIPVVWSLLLPPLRAAGLNEQYTQTCGYSASMAVCMLLTYAVFGQIKFPADAVSNRHPLLRYGWLGLAGAAGAFFTSMEVPDRKPTAIIFLGYILLNLMTAVCEEEMFRRMFFGVLTYDGNQFRKERVKRAAIIVCVLFGLRHFFNLILNPNQVVTCSFQAAATAFAGVYLLGLYLMCHSIIPVIVIHFMEDFSVTAIEIFSVKAVADAAADISAFQGLMMVAVQIPYLICGVIMMRKYLSTENS
jgi:membrane protease YdiL (CAAX protease family)